MQDFEKELKLRRLQEMVHIEKSTEENLYENQSNARKRQDQKINALNIIQIGIHQYRNGGVCYDFMEGRVQYGCAAY